MLRVRTSQLDAFSTVGAKDFYRALRQDLLDYMAREMPELAPADADRKAHHAVKLCQHYGFSSEAHVTEMSYVFIAFPAEFYFDARYQWLDAVLRAPISADARLNQVRAALGAKNG